MMWAFALLSGSALMAPVSVVLALALAQSFTLFNANERRFTGRAQQLLARTILQREVQSGRHLQIQDPATGLLERWYFDFRLREEAARCSRYRLSLAVLVFKTRRVESKQDRTSAELPGVARTIGRSLTAVDFATRLDEVEFAVSVLRSDEGGAEAAVRQLLNELGQWAVIAGFAVCPRDGGDGEALLERAQRHERLNDALGAVVVRAPGYRREAIDSLIREADPGSVTELALHPGETARSLKQKIRRASNRLGVEVEVWDEGSKVCLRKTAATSLEAKAA